MELKGKIIHHFGSFYLALKSKFETVDNQMSRARGHKSMGEYSINDERKKLIYFLFKKNRCKCIFNNNINTQQLK